MLTCLRVIYMTEIITMSSKGQIVVPRELRKNLGLEKGAHFTIFGKDDTLVLKRIDVPDAREAFEKIHKWGVELAKKKGWKEKDVVKKIHEGRGVK